MDIQAGTTSLTGYLIYTAIFCVAIVVIAGLMRMRANRKRYGATKFGRHIPAAPSQWPHGAVPTSELAATATQSLALPTESLVSRAPVTAAAVQNKPVSVAPPAPTPPTFTT